MLTASDRGVTADTIRLGVAVADVSEFVAIDDPVARFQAVADSINARGGVLGRQLELVPVTWPAIDTAAFEAACADLVEAEAFAVLAFAVLADLRCFSGDPGILTISLLGLDAEEVAGSGGRLLTVSPDPAGVLLEGIEVLAANLVGARVALIESPDRPDESADLQAALEDVGADLAGVDRVTATDTDALEAQFDDFADQWVATGVSHVVVPAPHAEAALGALQRRREPRITIVSSQLDVPTLTANAYDPATVSYIGVGPVPVRELVARNAHRVGDCLALVSEATGVAMTLEPPDGGPGNAASTIAICAAFDLFTAYAEAAGAELTTASFLEAGRELGPVPITGLPSATIATDKPYAGNAAVARYFFDPDANRFVPAG